MRTFAIAAAVAALFALPTAPASAAPVATDVSSQSIQIGPGGVRVHDRWDSRRRSDRRMDRRSDRRCRTEVTERVRPSGRVVRERRTVCRD